MRMELREAQRLQGAQLLVRLQDAPAPAECSIRSDIFTASHLQPDKLYTLRSDQSSDTAAPASRTSHKDEAKRVARQLDTSRERSLLILILRTTLRSMNSCFEGANNLANAQGILHPIRPRPLKEQQ